MNPRLIRLGVGACIMHRDPLRAIFKGKALLYVEQEFTEYAMRHGALVFLIPIPGVDPPLAPSYDDYIDQIDGLLLQGGADVAPSSYGEEAMRLEWGGDAVRDAYEIELIKRCLERGKPILGACRGIQILNVALGGTLYQDISTQVDGSLVHRDWEIYDQNVHEVVLRPGNWLTDLYPAQPIVRVNTVHHQAIKDVAPGLEVCAVSTADGIVEGVLLDDGARFAVAVQWHPEWTEAGPAGLLSAEPLMRAFLDKVRERMA